MKELQTTIKELIGSYGAGYVLCEVANNIDTALATFSTTEEEDLRCRESYLEDFKKELGL